MFDINSKILKIAEKLGFGDVAILSSEIERKQVRFANGEVTIAKNWVDRKINIFVELEKRVATMETTDFEHVEERMKDLFKIVKNMEKREDYYGIADGPFTYDEIEDTYDPRILEKDPVDFIKEAIDATGLSRVAGVLYVDHPSIYLSTNHSVEAKDEGTGIEISVRAFKGDLASGHATSSSRNLSKFNPRKAGEKAGWIANMVENPQLMEAGRYDVIFDPLSIGNLFSMMGHFTSAMAVEAGFSPFVKKIGQKIAAENFTLRDIGNLPNGYGTRKFDDEGVPTKNTTLIDGGMMKTYLLNTSYAKKYGTETTANAGLVMPRPWNLYVEPGDFSKDEIFNVKKAIYVTNIWYTRFQNYVAGDFSTIPRDGIFIVENGEIKSSVKNIRISDNILRILSNIDAMGKDPEQIHWWECEIPVFTPYVRVRDVGITRATQ